MSRTEGQSPPGNGEDQAHARTAAPPDRNTIEPAPESFGRGEAAPPRRSIFKRPLFWIIAGVVLIGGGGGGLLWYLHARNYASTDDAFVTTHPTNISPQIAGHVSQVLVKDNQDVKAGDLLVKIDPVDYQNAIDQAIAQQAVANGQLAQAKAQLTAAEANVGQTKADVASAQANATQAQADLERYRELDRRAVSQQQVDAATATARSTTAALEAARQKQFSAEAQILVAQSQIVTAQAQVKKAEVAVQQSQTQLGYAQIKAPMNGRISGKSVANGDYVQPGQALMALVPEEIWVVANFKETDLKGIHPGQHVEIRVDAYGETLKGKVTSIQAGSGAAFSLLPPENATGNYVKVVQRVPVRIDFDHPPSHLLGPGMSVVPTVDLRSDDQ